jgi:Skp family chaperone for outer membrane proteins
MINNSKKALLAACGLAFASPALAQKAPAAVIVVIDNEKVYSECNACKAANTQLQQQLQTLQTRAQQLGQPIQTEAEAIRTAAGGKAPDAALQARITALQTKQNTAQQEIAASEQTIQRNRAYVVQQLNTAVSPIIQRVMTARGANFAVDVQATLAIGAGVDVTSDVLTQLNAALPSVSVTAPPAPAQPAKPQGR